jgi:hypothetical protein
MMRRLFGELLLHTNSQLFPRLATKGADPVPEIAALEQNY